jgi:RES domain-containing protein
MEAEIPEPDLETEFVSLEEIEADYTAYRLAVDETTDPKEPLGYMVQAPFEPVEDEPIPAILWSKYLVAPFQRKGVIPPQRWNPDGSRCFYSALERDTAIAEVAHHVRKRLAHLGARSATVHYVKFSIEFHGKIVDVHALTSKHPELVYDQHHPNCHVVGRAALQRGSDGILVPSVRYEGGRCLAVYVPQAIKPGEFLERVVFFRSPSGDVLTERTPYGSIERKSAKPSDTRKRRGRTRAGQYRDV